MSKIELGLSRHSESQGRRSDVHLSSRDASDALRLMNLLANSQGRAMPAARELFGPTTSPFGSVEKQPSLKARARALLQQRRRRSRHFASSMFSEPAWDMLLALYGNEDSERRNTVSEISGLSQAPLTTALRWLEYLEQHQLITRRPSPTDRRVVFVDITPLGSDQITAYLEGIATLRP